MREQRRRRRGGGGGVCWVSSADKSRRGHTSCSVLRADTSGTIDEAMTVLRAVGIFSDEMMEI